MSLKKNNISEILFKMHQVLLNYYGPQSWWPAKTPFEVAVGAILVQNTNWTNVERVMKVLEEEKLLMCDALISCRIDRLSRLIRSVGYFNVKARRLKNFVTFLKERYGSCIQNLGKLPWPLARVELLSVNGIGPETADSILLYALHKPVFVVDVYTKRLLMRHGFEEEAKDYDSMQELFMSHLPEDVSLYNEFHALIVRLGKDYHRDALLCPNYPLAERIFSRMY